MSENLVNLAAILEKRIQLEATIDLQALIPKLLENGVYAEGTLQNEIQYGTTNAMKITYLLFGLKKKSSEMIPKFVKSLIDAKQYSAVKILCPDFKEPAEPVKIVPNPPPKAECSEQPLQYSYNPPFKIVPLSPPPDKIEEEQLYNNAGEEIAAHTLPDIDEVKVKKADLKYAGANPSDCYRMESQPRGYALIFVNEFNGQKDMYRRGAAKDRILLEDLFTQLGYKVVVHENTSRYAMQTKLQHFTSQDDLASTDSCIIVVSSHGEEDSIVCNDKQLLPINYIKEMFDNENCPHLVGKPKLFIIQACRGGKIDGGVVEEHDGPNVSLQPPSYIPTTTDMLIAYSTTPGYAANRTIIGSWYIYLLTDVFMKRAWNTELGYMLMEVNRRMKQLKTNDGGKQSAETVWQGWHSKFFFNPGL